MRIILFIWDKFKKANKINKGFQLAFSHFSFLHSHFRITSCRPPQIHYTIFQPRTGFFPKQLHDMNLITTYINESITELRQVRWPTRQQAIRFSAVVIAFVFVSAIFFGLIDIGLSELMKTLLGYAQ